MILRRGAVMDAIEIDGEVVVMIGEAVLLLGPIAGRVWTWAGDGVAEADLRERIFARFGHPGDPDQAWTAIIAELVRHGVIERVEAPQ